MYIDGSTRSRGVGNCAHLVPTLGDPGETSGPRTDGFHRLDHPRTPGASRPRGREDPSWVAAMACLWEWLFSKNIPAEGDLENLGSKGFHGSVSNVRAAGP